MAGSGEDPPEATACLNEETGPSRRMMGILDDNCEQLGSKIYVDLANIVGEFAKLERKAARMQNRLYEYDGSDCSVLVPSCDDEEEEEEDYGTDGDDPNEFGLSVDGSDISTRSSMSNICEISNEHKNEKMKRVKLSGYFAKYMGEYYAIPEHSIKRNYALPVIVDSVSDMRLLTTRGRRYKTWLNSYMRNRLRPDHIVVIQMNMRKRQPHTRGHGFEEPQKLEYYWGVILSCSAVDARVKTDDPRIIHLLPENITKMVHTGMLANVEGVWNGSKLLNELLPSFRANPNFINHPEYNKPPIPGPSRKRRFDGEVQREYGNWWQQISCSRFLKSAIDVRPRAQALPVTDDDDEE